MRETFTTCDGRTFNDRECAEAHESQLFAEWIASNPSVDAAELLDSLSTDTTEYWTSDRGFQFRILQEYFAQKANSPPAPLRARSCKEQRLDVMSNWFVRTGPGDYGDFDVIGYLRQARGWHPDMAPGLTMSVRIAGKQYEIKRIDGTESGVFDGTYT